MLSVNITKQLPDFTLQLEFAVDRDILVLFGPSGCGKTTTLRCIAGLLKPDEGRISCNGKTFYDSQSHIHMPPQARNIGYMFQDYALFPHMNVRKNIWYGVKQHSANADEMYHRLMGLLKIEHLEKRSVSQLSGGEKQRVALARALLAEPKILLLDEPLSSLDNTTRLELQAELKKMHELWGIPFILVTHDPEEARTMGDKILFIGQGKRIAPPPGWSAAGSP